MISPESFVPLTAAPTGPAPREFRVAILNAHDHQPLDHGSGYGIKPAREGGQNGSSSAELTTNELGNDGAAESVQAPDPRRPFSVNGSPGAGNKISEPRVTVQRDGDRVTHLRIQCVCGQIIELACVY